MSEKVGASHVDGLVAAAQLGDAGHPMLEVALALASARWRVLPCSPDDKRPLIQHGFKNRSDDRELVQRWWSDRPDATIGIVPGDGGLVACDVDSSEALAAMQAVGLLPAGLLNALRTLAPDAHLGSEYGLIVATGGTSQPFEFDGITVPPMHWYLRVTDGVTPRVKGVVCRYEAGYVIAPGCRGQKLYRLLSRGEPLPFDPTSAVEGAPSTVVPSSQQGLPATPSRPATALVTTSLAQRPRSFERVREAVACIPNTADTGRETWVAVVHAIKGALGDAGLPIFLEWAARWPGPVDAEEDERLYTTITTPRTGWYQLWRHAARFGFDARPEIAADAADDFDDAVTEAPEPPLHVRLATLYLALASIPDPMVREITRDQQIARLVYETRVPFRTLEKRLAAFDAPHRILRPTIIRPGRNLRDAIATAAPAALVPGYLHVGSQHVLFGAPGAFKTFLALDWALHLATGLPWLGRFPVRPRGVVFFAGEAARRLLIRQAAWYAARNVSVEKSESVPFALVDTVPTLGVGDDGLLDAVARIEEATNEPALLVFDNLTRMAAQSGLSTVDPSELGRVLAALDFLARKTGASTLTICHSPMSDPNKIAGSYPIMANPDVVLQAERGDGRTTTLRSRKTRDTADTEPLVLTLERQDVRDWLRASYAADGRQPPETLEVHDFDDLASSSTPADDRGERSQFASLVVAGGMSMKEAAAAETAAADQRARQEIRDLLAAHPDGLGQREIRGAVKLRDEKVAALLAELDAEGAVIVDAQGSGRTAKRLYRARAVVPSAPELPPDHQLPKEGGRK